MDARTIDEIYDERQEIGDGTYFKVYNAEELEILRSQWGSYPLEVQHDDGNFPAIFELTCEDVFGNVCEDFIHLEAITPSKRRFMHGRAEKTAKFFGKGF